jgi:hypothetical protein
VTEGEECVACKRRVPVHVIHVEVEGACVAVRVELYRLGGRLVARAEVIT